MFDQVNLKRSPTSPRTLFSIAMTGLTFACAGLALVPLITLLGYVIVQGGAKLSLALFTQLPPPPMVAGGGFANAIVGTLTMVSIAALISVPIGVTAAIFLTEFGPGTKFAAAIKFASNVLSGVPSIIVGVFAYGVIVANVKSFSALAGGFALAILMLPIIVRSAEESLKLVPQEVRQGAIGLGATKFQTVTWVVLPAALPTIITGVTLAVARAAGETAPLIFTALFTQFWSKSLLEPTASMAVLVYNFAIVPFKNQQELAWSASLILVFLVLITSIISRLATARKSY